nr:MAG TPA: hypothetical protein [Caudoviricetes sp.]
MGKIVSAVTKPITEAVKSVAKAPFDAVKAIGRGDISGVLDAGIRAGTMGTMSLSDKGIINPASVAKTLGMSKSGAPAVSGIAGAGVQVAKKKGLLSQLRTGKGGAGGGSFTGVAKDPLGGEAGKTGK